MNYKKLLFLLNSLFIKKVLIKLIKILKKKLYLLKNCVINLNL